MEAARELADLLQSGGELLDRELEQLGVRPAVSRAAGRG